MIEVFREESGQRVDVRHGPEAFRFDTNRSEAPLCAIVSADGSTASIQSSSPEADHKYHELLAGDQLRVFAIPAEDMNSVISEIPGTRTVAQEYAWLHDHDIGNRTLTQDIVVENMTSPYYLVVKMIPTALKQDQPDPRGRNDVKELLRLFVRPNDIERAQAEILHTGRVEETRDNSHLQRREKSIPKLTANGPMIITTDSRAIVGANVLHIDDLRLPKGVTIDVCISRDGIDHQNSYRIDYVRPTLPTPLDLRHERKVLMKNDQHLSPSELYDAFDALGQREEEYRRQCDRHFQSPDGVVIHGTPYPCQSDGKCIVTFDAGAGEPRSIAFTRMTRSEYREQIIMQMDIATNGGVTISSYTEEGVYQYGNKVYKGASDARFRYGRSRETLGEEGCVMESKREDEAVIIYNRLRKNFPDIARSVKNGTMQLDDSLIAFDPAVDA